MSVRLSFLQPRGGEWSCLNDDKILPTPAFRPLGKAGVEQIGNSLSRSPQIPSLMNHIQCRVTRAYSLCDSCVMAAAVSDSVLIKSCFE